MGTECGLGDGGGIRDLLPWGQGVAVRTGGVGDALPWGQEAQAEALPGACVPPRPWGHLLLGVAALGDIPVEQSPMEVTPRVGNPSLLVPPPAMPGAPSPRTSSAGTAPPRDSVPIHQHPGTVKPPQTRGVPIAPCLCLGLAPLHHPRAAPGLGRAGRTVLRGECSEPRPGSPGSAA